MILLLVATCIAAEASFNRCIRKLMATNEAAAAGLDAVMEPGAKLPVSQCTKTEGKQQCPPGQEQTCCEGGTCTTVKVLDVVFKPAAAKDLCELAPSY